MDFTIGLFLIIKAVLNLLVVVVYCRPAVHHWEEAIGKVFTLAETERLFKSFIRCLRVGSPQKFIQVELFLPFVQHIEVCFSQIHWLNVCFSQSRRGKKISITVLTWQFFLLPYYTHGECFALSRNTLWMWYPFHPYFPSLQWILLDQFYGAVSVLSLLDVPQL